MTLNEIVNFILPELGDPIQILFLLIIFLMMAGTMIGVLKYANESSWEKKWNRGKPGSPVNNLEVRHGSVTDLWSAVATAPEKIAEIMPSMLLVVGLLGTFLGLGLALNKASNILGDANLVSAGSTADSMSHLMGMLQGLGTKFKTSTWGIIGFILLNICSEVVRFDERRLAWVIAKVKSELEINKREENLESLKRSSVLHAQIEIAASKIVVGLTEEIDKFSVVRFEMHKQYLGRLDVQREGLREVSLEISGLLAAGQEMHKKSLAILDSQREGLLGLQNEMAATKNAMLKFSSSTQNIVKQMAGAAQQMASGAGEIGAAAERMADGADKVGVAGKNLVEAIDEFRGQFRSVLDDVRKDLGAAIRDMSAEAATTLEKGSVQLSDATREISTALGFLSRDVASTMNEVKDSIDRALAIQQRAANEFTLSASNLNENIEMTTNIVGELSAPIKDGLRSVSDAGQHMRSVGKSLDKSLQMMRGVVERLDDLPKTLVPLANLMEQQKEIISALTPLGDLSGGLQKIIQEIQKLNIKTNDKLVP